MSFLIGFLLFISCERQKESDFRIVKMTGGNLYINLSKRSPFADNMEDFEILNYQDSIYAEILEQEDIILIESDENHFYYRYSAEDGEFLRFSLNNSCLYVNEVLKSVLIDDENGNLECIKLDDKEILSGIQSLVLQDCSSPQCYSVLKRIKESNPSLGLITEEDSEGIDSIMYILDPEWIVCDNLNFNTDYTKNIRQICITSGKAEDLYQINNLPNLEDIIVYMDEPFVMQNIAINSHIRSLVIGSDNDLSIVDRFPYLRKLVVFNDSPLLDINALSNLKDLNVLILPYEVNMKDIQPLLNLDGLEWLNLPPNITDEDLQLIIDRNKKLKVVGVSNFNQMLDLEPLTSLKNLIGLNIYGNSFDLESLYTFDQLRYLGMPKEMLYDSTNFAQIKANLPETIIAPNNIGICLGTGWILIFIPVLAVVFLFLSAFRRIF